MFADHLEYLKDHPNVSMLDFAYTLQHRRSTLPYRKDIVAPTVKDAIIALEALSRTDAETEDMNARFKSLHGPGKLLGIFTGQGAQWPRMGARLIESSPFAASRIAELDDALQSITSAEDRPSWTVHDELLASNENSRLAEAALSQPLCSAVQILLVDILRAAGITFTAVVGHSSGEIGAAYAAGFLSAKDAIRIAYFRGMHAKLAASPSPNAPRGGMMAVAESPDAARMICANDFQGRLQLAAINSSSSVTLSGDEDAIDAAENLFKAKGTFARKLKVDTAYHSAHMAFCADPYYNSLQKCRIEPLPQSAEAGPLWYSSVYNGEVMDQSRLTNQYWVDNMCQTVLFADALAEAVKNNGPFDIAIEVGPHPALKGPATATINDETTTPYTGVLARGENDVAELGKAFGFIWKQLGSNSVQFSAVEKLLSASAQEPLVLRDLPPYPFTHQIDYWTDSRLANHFKHRNPAHVSNAVLGSPCTEATTPGEFQWRNILQQSEIPWLNGHALQGQTVFPATGYASMAFEAMKSIAFELRPGAALSLIKLVDLDIPRAIAFDDDDMTVETIFSVSSVAFSGTKLTADWACYSAARDGTVQLNAKGGALVELSLARPDTLPVARADPYNLVPVNEDQFYESLTRVGYNYAHPFRGISDIRRKPGYSVGTLSDQAEDDDLVLHPGLLDSALQSVFAAWAYPGDTQLWSLHVPVSISSITINPYFTSLGDAGKQATMKYESSVREHSASGVTGDVYLYTDDFKYAFIQFQGAKLIPFAPAVPKNDMPMFSRFDYPIAVPDGQLAGSGETLTDYEVQLYKDIDRISYWFLRNASISIPAEYRSGLLPHYQRYLAWCDRMVSMVGSGSHNKVHASCNNDSRSDIDQTLALYSDRKDVRFVQVVGDNLVQTIKDGNSMLEHMNQDGLLRAFYEEGAICSGPTGRWLARVLAQISKIHPSLNILEVGAGTGATTSAVLDALEGRYASYTFTDISSGFFMAAEERFGQQDVHRMTFKTFDMEKEPETQGFSDASYDVVVAVNVLHVSADIEASLSNVRRLLKPGGFLVTAELTSTDLLFSGMTVGTLPGWWIGAETGRPWGPLFTLGQWDSVLKNTGFAGIDTVSPDISASLPMSVFVAQAVDDRVSLLRNPLSVKVHPAGIRTDVLAIIGGTTWPVYKLSREIYESMGHRFQSKRLFNTVEEFAKSDLAKMTEESRGVTILSLADLDRPYLEGLTGDKFESLKTCMNAGVLIWVTCGSRDDQPYSSMMTGIARTIRTERPGLNILTYDLDPAVQNGIHSSTAADLSATVLRQVALTNWGTDSMLWSLEPDTYVRNGRHLVSRIVPDHQKNDRYNSQRRRILTAANPSNANVELVGVGLGNEQSIELRHGSPLAVTNSPATATRTIRVTHSLLQSIAVGAGGFVRVCAGVDSATQEHVLALTDSSQSTVQVPQDLCMPLSTSLISSKIVAIGAHMVADRLLSFTSRGSTLIINEPDLIVQKTIRAKASTKNIQVICVTSNIASSHTNQCVYLDPSSPVHVVQSLVENCSVFVHFSRGVASDAVRDSIVGSLSPSCLEITEEMLVSHKVDTLSSPSDSANVLKESFSNDTHEISSFETFSLADATSHKAIGEPLAVVDWTESQSVLAMVQSIDSQPMFRSDRSYLFVGMTGELGQSLAGWMITHGARFIVLTSRRPTVNLRFVDDMYTRYGAVVKAVPLDITLPESLQSVLASMAAALPPIAGVINGAMVLDDELFENMSFKQFSQVTKPKVLGTQLLDQAFHSTDLEFFIVASSISSVIGWSGQSNYSAANEFMTSLVNKRRKRGVAGSTMNIPAVLGVGYAAHSETFDFDYFQSLGYINISEHDLQILFAETILTGRPGQAEDSPSQVVMGINYVPKDLQVTDAHRRDVKFSQFILNKDTDSEVQAHEAAVRVRVQLQSAKTADEAYTVTRDAFIGYLKRILRRAVDEIIDDSMTLVEQGVDSLVAVDIRAWFLKELQADVPTLKVMSGGPISELVKTGLAKMPSLEESVLTEPVVPSENEAQRAPPTVPQAGHSRPTSGNQSRSSSPQTESPIFTPAQDTLSTLSDNGTARTPSPPGDYFAKTPVGSKIPDWKGSAAEDVEIVDA
jgi:acyl transferase domain-containing protein/NADP-dependent 3-hydroxy acid dehydrogenase YdfG